jgi:hypothetical protein
MKKPWETHLNERELKEVNFCREYARNYSHGTDGHSRMIVISKLADLLDKGVISYRPEKTTTAVPAKKNKPPSGA